MRCFSSNVGSFTEIWGQMGGLDEIHTITFDHHNYSHFYLIYFLTDVKHDHK